MTTTEQLPGLSFILMILIMAYPTAALLRMWRRDWAYHNKHDIDPDLKTIWLYLLSGIVVITLAVGLFFGLNYGLRFILKSLSF